MTLNGTTFLFEIFYVTIDDDRDYTYKSNMQCDLSKFCRPIYNIHKQIGVVVFCV